jgi:hypothetical protein
MPTVLRIGPYRFFFYAGDRTEPPHIHVERDDGEVKFWLDPVRFEGSQGFTRKEINKIGKLVEGNQQQLLESWNEFFIG